MSADEQTAYIREMRDQASKTLLPASHEHICVGCTEVLVGKHLRVSFANPDSPWRQLRFHDLLCLQDFLEDEDEADGAGKVFTRQSWIDAKRVAVSGDATSSP